MKFQKVENLHLTERGHIYIQKPHLHSQATFSSHKKGLPVKEIPKCLEKNRLGDCAITQISSLFMSKYYSFTATSDF